MIIRPPRQSEEYVKKEPIQCWWAPGYGFFVHQCETIDSVYARRIVFLTLGSVDCAIGWICQNYGMALGTGTCFHETCHFAWSESASGLDAKWSLIAQLLLDSIYIYLETVCSKVTVPTNWLIENEEVIDVNGLTCGAWSFSTWFQFEFISSLS